jgi:hypothetical protein
VPRSRSLLVGPLSLLTVASLGGAAAWALSARPPAALLVARERHVLEVVRGVARAEESLRARGTVDRDGDKTGEYGSVSDLDAARLVGDLGAPVVDGALAVDGYRVVALLPRETDRSGRLAFSRERKDVDPTLASRFFAVAAMPRADEPSGLRAFYLDSTGGLWTAEGVCDGERHPFVAPPTRSLIQVEETPLEGGLVWRHRAGPPPKAPSKTPK